MTSTHTELALQAARVAVTALRAVDGVRSILGAPNGEMVGFQRALTTLQLLYAPPAPPRRRPTVYRPPAPKAALPEPSKLREVLQKRVRAVTVDDVPDAAWDPEPLYESRRCQALLLEVIRRATYDWVLYRQHFKLELRELAQNAYVWLFEEEPGHRAWKERESALFRMQAPTGADVLEVGSRRLTSFLSICEIVGLDPETVRDRAREMTANSIVKTGRHMEWRRSDPDCVSIEAHSIAVDIDLDALDADFGREDSDYSW